MRLLLVLAVPALSACTVVIGPQVESCGEHPADGGPAVVSTKDQELCEIVRVRVARAVLDDADLSYAKVQSLLEEKVPDWETRHTIDELIARVRRDAGDPTADAVRRAVDVVVAQSKRPMPADCPETERCLVKGAAKGLRLALYAVRPGRPATPTDVPHAR